MTLAIRPTGPHCTVAVTHGRVYIRTSMPSMAYAIAYYDPFVAREYIPMPMVADLVEAR
jgi:hypothetical protein